MALKTSIDSILRALKLLQHILIIFRKVPLQEPLACKQFRSDNLNPSQGWLTI